MDLNKTFLIFFILFCINSGVFGAEKIVRVATLDEYAPFCFPKEKNIKGNKELVPPGSDSKRLQGYSWDILRESFHAMGYTICLDIYPWKRAMHDTRNGVDDLIFPIGKNPEREKIYIYSKEAVDQDKFLIFVPLHSKLKWNGLASLKGVRIGEMRGWNYGKEWADLTGVDKQPVNKVLQGFKMLDKGRFQGFAGYEINFGYLLKKQGLKGKYKTLPSFGSSTEYVAGPKTNERVPLLLNDFDLGKRKIVENGLFDRIETKWR